MGSAISTPTWMALAKNLYNENGTTPIYGSGAWDFKNASGTTTLSVSSAGSHTFSYNNSGANHLIYGNGLLFAKNTGADSIFFIASNTSDGSDNQALYLCSGGTSDPSRGAYIRLFGNESDFGASLQGKINYCAGTCASSSEKSHTWFAGSGATEIASATEAGAWTLGADSGSGAHLFRSAAGVAGAIATVRNTSDDSGVLSIGGSTTYTNVGINSSGFNVVTGSASGAVYQGNNSASWSTTSDERIKANIRDINGGLEKICALRPRHFEYKNNLGKIKTGFVAQEFETVLPGHVTTSQVTEESEFAEFLPDLTIKSIDTDLIPYLVKAIQELSAKLDEANAKIAALEAK